MSVLAHLESLERALVAKGFPAMSPWWRSTVTRFYESGRRQLVARVGRRGGKSSTLCRIAVLEALFGEHVVPPGDLGVVAIISVSRDEASGRLRTVKAILDALGVKYRPIDGGIELEGRPIAFKIYAASISGVSGFTAIAVIADEVAKWKDSDTGANPAKEVLASLRPTMATQRRARIFLSSSPLGPNDAHAVAFDEGETDYQCIAYAPTWVAHPAITEEETHLLERDLRVWRREYLAEPQASALSALDPDHVCRAIGRDPPQDFVKCARILLVDPTAGSSDTYAFATCAWRIPGVKARFLTERRWSNMIHEWEDCVLEDERGQPRPNPEYREETASAKLVFDWVDGIDQAARRGFTSDTIVTRIVTRARQSGVVAIHSDQFERFALASAIGKHGIPFMAHSWTAPLKERAVERVRQWLRDDLLCLPKHDKLKSELLAFEERIAPSGALTFRGRQGGHDDFAMLVMLAALVDIEGGLPGSPLHRPIRRLVWSEDPA
jgi:hypothetical protein